MAQPIIAWVLSAHASAEMARRGIDEDMVNGVLSGPEQRIAVRPGRDVLQSRVLVEGKVYVVRVFVDIDRDPPEVVTAYRSSKIEKYWSSRS